MRVSFVPYRRGQRKFQLLLNLILSRQSREQKQVCFMPSNFAERKSVLQNFINSGLNARIACCSDGRRPHRRLQRN